MNIKITKYYEADEGGRFPSRTAQDGTIFEFLTGEKSYEGVWFGDKHPKRTGSFWWRSVLRDVVSTPSPSSEINTGKAEGIKTAVWRDAKKDSPKDADSYCVKIFEKDGDGYIFTAICCYTLGLWEVTQDNHEVIEWLDESTPSSSTVTVCQHTNENIAIKEKLLDGLEINGREEKMYLHQTVIDVMEEYKCYPSPLVKEGEKDMSAEVVEKYCEQHGIDQQTLIDVYQERLDNISNMIDNNGIYLISEERKEQISKHGRTVKDDIKHNADGQLRFGAINLISNAIARENGCPKEWDQDIYNKMANKSLIDRLIISGALIAAEIDRLNNQK